MISAHTPETQEWFQSTFIPAYTKERPKVNVTMNYVTWDDLFAKRGAPLFAAGSGPEVLQAGADDTVEYVRNGYTVNLRDRVAKWKEWAASTTCPKEATTSENHVTGVPAQLRPRALYIRKDLFDRRGVKPPTTWDEMRTAAVALTERNGTEVTVAGYNPGNWGYQQFFPMVWQAGAEMAQPDLKRVLFATPQVVDGLRFWMDLLNQIQPPGATLGAVPTGIPQIVHGTFASQVDAPGQLDTAIKRVPEVLDKLLVRPPLKKEKALSFFSTNWFCAGAQAKNPDLAWACCSSSPGRSTCCSTTSRPRWWPRARACAARTTWPTPGGRGRLDGGGGEVRPAPPAHRRDRAGESPHVRRPGGRAYGQEEPEGGRG